MQKMHILLRFQLIRGNAQRIRVESDEGYNQLQWPEKSSMHTTEKRAVHILQKGAVSYIQN